MAVNEMEGFLACLWSCSQKLWGMDSYLPIFKALCIYIWTLKFKSRSLVLYFLLLSITSRWRQRTTWHIVTGRFWSTLTVTFLIIIVHPLPQTIWLTDGEWNCWSKFELQRPHVYERCSNMDNCCHGKLNIPVLQVGHFIQTVPNYADKSNHKPSCKCVNIKISLMNLMLQNWILGQ